MIDVSDRVLDNMSKGEIETVIPRSERPAGSGMLFMLKEKLSPHFDIYDFRMVFFTPTDFNIPVMEDGEIKYLMTNRMKELVENTTIYERDYLVILDEFEAAMPAVQKEMDAVIEKAKQNKSRVHFVKLG